MSAICVIPARQGSKRIPNKNTKKFLGWPTIVRVFEIVKKSGLFDTIICSTDDKQAGAYAQEYGINVLARPERLADDHATTSSVLEHCLHHYDGYNSACVVYPTSVFVTKELLERGRDLLPIPSFCAQRYPAAILHAFVADEDSWRSLFPLSRNERSQDMAVHFYDAGQFYWVDTSEFLRHPFLLDDGCIGVIPDRPCWDINTPDDWRMAEAIYKEFYSEQERS